MSNIGRKRATSDSHPIYVSWLPSSLPGKVGLTFAPGKKSSSNWSHTQWDRDLHKDLDRLAKHFRVKVLVSLLEEHELERYEIPDLFEQVPAHGIELRRLPIVDGSVLPELRPVEKIISEITEHAEAGHNVVIHCAGGLGRTGTIGGCWLVSQGMNSDEVLETLHRVRSPNCPETRGQEKFIRDFEKHLRASQPKPSPSSRVAGAVQPKPSPSSRVAGAVLSAAIGDAMGHPTEFLSMAAIVRKYGPQGVQGFELFWERDGKRFSPYTDDTQMAELVLRTLIESQEQQRDLDATMRLMADAFVHWSTHPQGGHRAPGGACLAGCRALAAGTPWQEAGGATAGGCGSVMRAYPFGLVFHKALDQAELWAVEHSKLTHGDPIALAACAAMALGVAHAFRGDEVKLVAKAMISAARTYSPKTAKMMQLAHDEALAGVGPAQTLDRLRGWAAHEAIAAALYVLMRHADDPRAAILEGANTPGDSDSIATLAGALVGARCGLEALPTDWLRDLERHEVFLELAGRVRV